MEVSLFLPLALALAEVFLFARGRSVYAVPAAVVEEVLKATRTLVLEGRPALEVRGEPLPVSDVAAVLGAQAPPLPDQPAALVLFAGGHRAVVTCDSLLGQEEVVVKPLGPLFAGAHDYRGATLLGDGRIALLLDPVPLTCGRREMTSTAAAQATPPVAASPGEGSGESGEPGAAGAGAGPALAPKVLVVEDSFTVRELQRSILAAAGYRVATARDGRDALAVLEQDPEIALVVTDIEMPELDGLSLTRAIRADPERSSLPVVVVTAHGTEEAKREGVAAGADAFMVKREYDQEALLATVERLVGR